MTTSGADFSTRSSSTDYDVVSGDRGQFPQVVTNALGHQETWDYDKRFGQPELQTGPNGLSSAWEYDVYGRTKKELRPDGTSTEYVYEYCSGVAGGTASCPTHAAYLVRATSHAPGGAPNGPATTVYSDTHGREVASDTEGFDGRIIRVVTIYDANGRTERESKPFFLDQGAPAPGDPNQWTRYSFDPLGRVVEVTLPGNRTETTTYGGLTTIQTNTLGHTTTTVKNARGEVQSITHNQGFSSPGNDTDITTQYTYDASGNLTHITDSAGNVSVTQYDRAGRKTYTDDPDMGQWSYSYNALGELVTQTDAKAQVSSMTYDLLGRPLTRTDADGVSTWTYDTQAKGIGKLATATRGTHTRTVFYDSLGRANRMDSTLDGVTETYSLTFDASSRVDQVTYPSGLVTKTLYNTWGYEYQLLNASTSAVLWTANKRDQELRLLRETAGNGVETRRTFDLAKGTLDTITAGLGNAVANFSYQFDAIGNLTQRRDFNESLSEDFCYDRMNRVTHYGMGTPGDCYANAKTVSYDRIGNITNKSDVGVYSYASGRPHAVTATTGVLNESYAYDANGNMLHGAGRTITWTAFNKVHDIVDGGVTTAFTYDADNARVKMTDSRGATFYFAAFGVMAEKLVKTSGDTKWTNYLYAAGAMVGVEITEISGGVTQSVELKYFVADHLGSVAVITDHLGVVEERLSYDAWGKRRYPSGADDTGGILASSVMTRGFTGHEMLDDTDLVQMNGRIYDPSLGKFLSADPFIQDKYLGASLNRYSYVWNNPLSYTDPSGYLVGALFAGVKLAIHAFAAYQVYQEIPVEVRPYLAIAAAAIINPALIKAGVNGFLAAGISGGTASVIATGRPKAFLTGAAQGALTYGIGQQFGAVRDTAGSVNWGNEAGRAIAHGALGGAVAEVRGGDFASGFLAAGFSSLASSAVEFKNVAVGTAYSAVAGGIGSELGGGKFSDGAQTGAFAYMFNHVVHRIGKHGDIVQERFENEDGVHLYEFKAKICNIATTGCNDDYADEVFDFVDGRDVPFGSPSRGNGLRRLLGFQPIRHLEYPDQRVSINRTMPGHFFHEGTVTHAVYFNERGNLYYSVIGAGSGSSPALNNLAGRVLFRPTVFIAAIKFGK